MSNWNNPPAGVSSVVTSQTPTKILSFTVTQALTGNAACTPYAISAEYSGAGPQAGTGSGSDVYNIYGYCQDCIWIGESAWGAGTRYVNPGNWGTYTAYAVGSVPLLAGQTMNAGTVSFSPIVAGKVTVIVALNAGWRFADVKDNVKIQGYGAAPTTKPVPGKFASKSKATGSTWSVQVPANNYFGVHVDVEWEDCSGEN
jgi:hypothetical protein